MFRVQICLKCKIPISISKCCFILCILYVNEKRWDMKTRTNKLANFIRSKSPTTHTICAARDIMCSVKYLSIYCVIALIPVEIIRNKYDLLLISIITLWKIVRTSRSLISNFDRMSEEKKTTFQVSHAFYQYMCGSGRLIHK